MCPQNKFPFFLGSLLLLVVCGCKPTEKVIRSTAISSADQVQLNQARNGFTYLKGGKSYKIKRAIKGTFSAGVTDSIFALAIPDTSIDQPEVLLITYYPAKTPSNSSGSCDDNCIKKWYLKVDNRIAKLDKTASSYVKKPGAIMGKYSKVATWIDDTDLLIERYFVPHPQIGNSFIILCRDGNYRAYLGEYPQDYLLETFGKVYVEHFKHNSQED